MSIERRPLPPTIPHGAGPTILLIGFLVLLGGRLTPDRFHPALPGWDLRSGGAWIFVIGFIAWYGVAVEKRYATNGVGAMPVWLAAFCGWMMLTALWAPQGSRLGDALLSMALLAILIGCMLALVARLPREAVDSLWMWLLLAACLYFAGSLLSPATGQGRYAAFGGGPNVYARVLALGIVAALAVAYTRNRYRFLWAVPVLALGIMLSGSRGGLVSLLTALALGLLPLYRRAARRLKRRLIGVALAGISGMAWIVPANVWSSMQQRYIQQTIVDRYDSGRGGISERAIDQFQQAPLAGIGIDGYFATGQHAHAHNLVLSAMAEGGLIGLVLLVAALAAVAFGLVRHRPLEPNTWFFVLAGTVILVSSMFSGDYYDSRFMWFFFGVSVVEARRSRHAATRRVPVQQVRADQASSQGRQTLAHEASRDAKP